MKQEENYKISFAESALKGKQILAKQPVTTYEKALAQVQMLKQNSKGNQELKKGKANG